VDHLGRSEQLVGLLNLESDAVVLLVGHVARAAASADASGESAPFLVQLNHPALGPGQLRLGLFVLVVKLGLNPMLDDHEGGLRHSHNCVVAHNSLLYCCCREVLSWQFVRR
jgi:hypothetical protein